MSQTSLFSWCVTWLTRWLSQKEQESHISEHLSSSRPEFLEGSCCSIFSFMCSVLSFLFWPLYCLSFVYLRPMITSSVYSHISFYLLIWFYQHCLFYLMQLWDKMSKVIGSSVVKRQNLTPDYALFKRVYLQLSVIIVKNEFTHFLMDFC